MIKYSIVIPVYNRPIEVQELLESLQHQSYTNFEIIIVEDGSSIDCKEIINQFIDKLDIKYKFKENSGPGDSRNVGISLASGDYIIFFDSDCIIPKNYFEHVNKSLESLKYDAFGGPDDAHESFTTVQKAINYAMTSFITTGGIRGKNKSLEDFNPRSFNMGMSLAVAQQTNGFSKMRFGEDIDLSIRIKQLGFKAGLIEDAFVYHKRRTNLKQFFKQIFNSGSARIHLYKLHPNTLKLIHFFPAIFTIGVFVLLILALIFSVKFLLPLLLLVVLIFIDSAIKNKSILIGLTSIVTSYTQLLAYGLGFIYSFIKIIILKKDDSFSFVKNFYK